MKGNLESLFKEFEVEKLHLINIQGGAATMLDKTGDPTCWTSLGWEGHPPDPDQDDCEADAAPNQATTVSYVDTGIEVADEALVMIESY